MARSAPRQGRVRRRGRLRSRFGRPATLAALAALATLAVSACGSSASPAAAPPHTSSTAPAGGATTPATSAVPGTGPDVTSTAADWPTYDATASRSGVSTSTPAPTHVARAWTVHLDGDVYGQPLVSGREVVVATENDSVYAFDTATGAQLWRRHLATPVTGGLPCGNIDPSGITGTPVADAATGRVWLVTFAAGYRHTLWELELSNGSTVLSRDIDAPGSDPRAEQQRGALALLGSDVYVPYGGLDGDCSGYKGRVVAAPLASATGALHGFVTPNQREAGIWSPPGPAVYGGSLYVATGNGTPVKAVDDSDSVLRLSPTLAQEGRFTPSDFEKLSADDLDLGSTSPAVVDGYVFEIGKQGVAYLMEPADLGGTGGQRASLQVCGGAAGGDAVDGSTVLVSCYSGLYAVRVTPAPAGGRPSLRVEWRVTGSTPGPPIVAGGIVWDVTRANDLVGYRLSDGSRYFSASTAPVVTSFPSLSASGVRLFVPEGSELVAYGGA